MRQYSVGDRVTQPEYGEGTVCSVNSYHTKIDFDAHGMRTFATDRVVLLPSATVAPARPTVRRKRAPRATATPQAPYA